MEPWWTSQQAGLFGGIAGSLIGIFGGILGTTIGICAPRGKCKRFIFTSLAIMLGLGAVSLLSGAIAIALGQAYHVWYPFLLCGGILVLVLGPQVPMVRARFRQAEMRRLEAETLRRG